MSVKYIFIKITTGNELMAKDSYFQFHLMIRNKVENMLSLEDKCVY